jgi:hypothetical protein
MSDKPEVPKSPAERIQELIAQLTPEEQEQFERILIPLVKLPSKEEESNYELIEINCVVCDVPVGPMDSGLWINERAICGRCAQDVWLQLQFGYNHQQKEEGK